MLLTNVDCKLYNSIKNIYSSSVSSISINNKLTDWFECSTGVKQGCCLSPTPFAIFAHDIVQDVNGLDLGISMGEVKISIFVYVNI